MSLCLASSSTRRPQALGSLGVIACKLPLQVHRAALWCLPAMASAGRVASGLPAALCWRPGACAGELLAQSHHYSSCGCWHTLQVQSTFRWQSWRATWCQSEGASGGPCIVPSGESRADFKAWSLCSWPRTNKFWKSWGKEYSCLGRNVTDPVKRIV